MTTIKKRRGPGRPWKPGQSGNPGGAKPVPLDVKAARSLTIIEFTRIVNVLLYMTREEIQKVAADPKTPAMEVMIASILGKAITGADYMRANFLLDRIIGKAVDPIDVTTGGDKVHASLAEMVLCAINSANDTGNKDKKG